MEKGKEQNYKRNKIWKKEKYEKWQKRERKEGMTRKKPAML